ncbi:DEAD/DEAH box helicase [Paramicrobacterium agarici]|uniref:SNF2 family DNA or RNA helicase n=1 Tax=Paramicrobacterium agarici TaxID=630514 RepID=A0A2A9DV25_9MICO|nr:DEAD/DEAH box helicase [Microbacterium agarici]PFG30201.1 SNF2 family DNA or RNA helicase [Microbacterium agarici]
MSGVPDEMLPALDASVASSLVDAATLTRARPYAQSGAVTNMRWNVETRTLTAHVLGNSAAPYRCRIDLTPTNNGFTPTFTACSCPVQARCKHIAATLLACAAQAASQAEQREDAAARPAWKTAVERLAPAERPSPTMTHLALGFELRNARGPSRRGSTTATRASLRSGTPVRLGIRPLMPGKRGGWIKGSLSWRTLAHQVNRLALEPRQLLWFTQLLGLFDATRERWLMNEPDDLSIDEFRSPLLWTLLKDAETIGVSLVGINRGMTVRLADSAQVSLDVRAEGEGLALHPLVTIGGERVDASAVAPIGDHGVYTYDTTAGIVLTLAPVFEPLTGERRALITHTEPVTVPPDGTAEFFTEYFPRMTSGVTVVSSDESVDLPEVAPPVLVLTATYGKRDALRLAWHWEYHDPQRTLALHAVAGERRDIALETETLSRVERTWPGSTERTTHELRDVATAEFTEHVLPALESLDGVRVIVSGTRPAYRELTESPHVAISTIETDKNDWFDLGIVITIEGRTIPFIDLFNALARGKKKLKLVDNSYFSLAHPAFDRLRELLAEADALDEWEPGHPTISRYQVGLWSDFEDLADETDEAVSWRSSVSALNSGTVDEVAVPDTVNAELRPYQVQGFHWLAFLWKHRLGGILADDMGLGKTLQTLTLVAHAREVKGADAGEPPFLVVAPTSVVSTWKSEAERFVPHLDVRVISATHGKRRTPLAAATAGADVVIMSYAVMRIDAADVAEQSWAGLILDEAQFIKNPDAKAHLAAKDIVAPFRLAITGTPLENTLLDLWALCSITAPGLFPSRRRFGEEYVRPIESGEGPERLPRLRRRIRPFLMRRTKELVAPELPDKQEQTLTVELSAAHRSLYDTVLQRERKKLLGLIDDIDRNRFIVFRSLTLLRILALDPALVDNAYADVPSSKLDALFEHLDDVLAEGHRTLVFSQFTSFLGTVAERLDARGIRYSYLDGSTRRRGDVIDGFRTGDDPVFLISLKAGGFGLTLTEADYVFLLDPWWNPASEAQAIDRTHRIGQAKNVFVYRLVAEGTIEEKVLQLQRKKAALFDAVVDDDAAFSSALTADDIRMLLDDA